MFHDLIKYSSELNAEPLSSSCFLGDGHGGFRRVDLPFDLQLAPVFMFVPLEDGSYLAGGNFYGVLPYEGRYDALQPTQFRWDKAKSQLKPGRILPAVNGEIRDAKWIRTAKHGNMLIIARNNEPLLFYTSN
jgi:hypothetical protein